MKGFVALHGRRLGAHPMRALLSVIGIGAACALLVAVLGLSGSLTGSIARTADVAGRADIQVSGVTDTGFDDRLLAELEQIPGAAAVVPYVQRPVDIGGTRALLVGFDRRAAALDAPDGSQPQPQPGLAELDGGGILIGSGLAGGADIGVGDEVEVRSGQTSHPARAVGPLAPGPLTRLNDGVVALAALPRAQELTGRPHRLDGVYLVASPSTTTGDLERRVVDVVGDRAVVATPRLLADQAAASATALRTGLLTVSTLSLLVAGFVVFNTMNMAALERRREIATLRALGGRRRPLLIGFLAEAAVVGFVGSAIGTAAGLLAARALVTRLPTGLVAAFDLRIDFIVPSGAIPLALAIGPVLSVAAALTPAWRAVQASPVEAMRPDGVLESGDGAAGVRWPAAIGGLAALILGAGSAVVVGEAAALPAISLFWAGGIAATFGFAAPLASATGWFSARFFGTSGQLAAASLARSPRRVFVTASAVAAALALVVTQTGTQRNVTSTLHDNVAALADVDVVVTTPTPENIAADQLLPDQLVTDLGQLDGVSGIAAGQDSYATIGVDRVLLRGVAEDSAIPELRLAPETARQRVLAGTAVVVTTQFAKNQHVSAGDTLTLPTPTGAQRLPIAAVVDAPAVTGGNVVLTLPALQRWFERPGVSRIELTAAPGADHAALRAATSAIAGSNARVEPGTQAARRLEGANQQISAAFTAIEVIIIVAAGLALLNTLAISVLERRRELGILRAIGTSRRQVRRAVIVEALAIGSLGAAIGLPLGIVGHYLAVLSTRRVGGLPVDYRFETAPLLLAELAAIALTVAACWAPARRSSRLNVIEAIGYE